MTQTLILAAIAFTASACAAPSASRPSQTSQSAECDDARYRTDQEVFCEKRTITIDPRDLALDTAPNGGIEVDVWDRQEIEIVASVKGVAPTVEEARRLVDETRIDVGNTVRAVYPSRSERSRSDRRSVSVSYKVRVPRSTNLDLETVNGGIAVSGVVGEIHLNSVNGGVSVSDVNGDVRARTTNGGITVALAGSRWEGSGLDLQTTNGGVTMSVPSDYSASLSVSTRNGGISVDDVTQRNGNVSRGGNRNHYEVELGRGGAPIRAETSNGGIRVRRR